ncbi:MAG: hypothetical protein ABXS93_02250 [Sulfurimonas sp.]
MKKLTSPINDKGEYYIKQDDMDAKKKKAFELVLLVSGSKKLSIATLDKIKEFIDLHSDMIKEYDNSNKDIYLDRLKKGYETAMINIQTISRVHRDIDTLR